MENFKCLVFIDFSSNCCKIIKFLNKEVALLYYSVALKKNNFRYAGFLKECVEWCKKNKYKYKVIEREKYNLYE